MKVSIVTVCFNSQSTIFDCLNSVINQDFENLEHIIIDGGSSDGTASIVKAHAAKVTHFVSEPDDGIYHAMNKGAGLATGDIICFLNSDDYYTDECLISKVVAKFEENHDIDYVVCGLNFVDKDLRIVRYWAADPMLCKPDRLGQIAHPSMFIKMSVLKKLDVPFDASYRISADLKQQLTLKKRFKVKGAVIDSIGINMRDGGASTRNLSARFLGWRESARAYNDVFERGGFMFTVRKVGTKFGQIFHRKL